MIVKVVASLGSLTTLPHVLLSMKAEWFFLPFVSDGFNFICDILFLFLKYSLL